MTSAKLIIGREQIQQLGNAEQLEKLRYLEDLSRYDRSRKVEEYREEVPPRFVTELNGRKDHVELSSCHMEGRIEPYPDETMKVTWEKDGQPLSAGSRFKPLYNFGFAALDVLQLVKEDSGVYTCRAKNNWGEAVSTMEIAVHRKFSRAMQLVNGNNYLKKNHSSRDTSHHRHTTCRRFGKDSHFGGSKGPKERRVSARNFRETQFHSTTPKRSRR